MSTGARHPPSLLGAPAETEPPGYSLGGDDHQLSIGGGEGAKGTVTHSVEASPICKKDEEGEGGGGEERDACLAKAPLSIPLFLFLLLVLLSPSPFSLLRSPMGRRRGVACATETFPIH